MQASGGQDCERLTASDRLQRQTGGCTCRHGLSRFLREKGRRIARSRWFAKCRPLTARIPVATGPRRRWRPGTPAYILDAAALVFVLVFLAGLVLNLVEPFGLANASKAQSMRLSARVAAPFYDDSARDAIAVVLIDDRALDGLGMGWPPTYRQYDALLQRVLEQRPRAVYLDVLLLEEREYDDSFESAYASLNAAVTVAADEADRKRKIPVFFGVGAPGQCSIFSSEKGVQDVVTGWQGVGAGYPLSINADSVHEGAAHMGCDRPGVTGAGTDSVAFALYRHACAKGTETGCREAVSAFPSAAMGLPLAVQWGWRPPVRDGDGTRCEGPQDVAARRPSPTRMERWVSAAGLAWDSFRGAAEPGREDRKRERCVFPLTVFADALVHDETLMERGPGGRPLLEDRVVLIGTRLVGLDDLVSTPVNQQVPGVYLHAMALDNLMQWGHDRVHVNAALGPWIGLGTAVLMSLAAGWLLFRAGPGRLGVARLLGLFAVLALIACLQVWFVQGVLRQPPQDWLGLGALVLGAVLWVASKGAEGCNCGAGGHDNEDALGGLDAGGPGAAGDATGGARAGEAGPRQG